MSSTIVERGFEAAVEKLIELATDGEYSGLEMPHRFAAIDRLTDLYRHEVIKERTEMILADRELVRLVYEDGKSK